MNIEKLAKNLKTFTLDEILMLAECNETEAVLLELENSGKLLLEGEIYTYIEKSKTLNFELIEKPNFKTGQRIFFEDAVRGFLADRKLTENTLNGYKYQLKYNILPYFGKFHADEITFDMIKNFMQNLRQKYSPKTVSNSVTLTGSILKWAFENGFIEYNPYLGIKNPRVRYEK